MEAAELGKFIATIRKEKQLTQAELARKLNVTDKALPGAGALIGGFSLREFYFYSFYWKRRS